MEKTNQLNSQYTINHPLSRIGMVCEMGYEPERPQALGLADRLKCDGEKIQRILIDSLTKAGLEIQDEGVIDDIRIDSRRGPIVYFPRINVRHEGALFDCKLTITTCIGDLNSKIWFNTYSSPENTKDGYQISMDKSYEFEKLSESLFSKMELPVFEQYQRFVSQEYDGQSDETLKLEKTYEIHIHGFSTSDSNCEVIFNKIRSSAIQNIKDLLDNNKNFSLVKPFIERIRKNPLGSNKPVMDDWFIYNSNDLDIGLSCGNIGDKHTVVHCFGYEDKKTSVSKNLERQMTAQFADFFGAV